MGVWRGGGNSRRGKNIFLPLIKVSSNADPALEDGYIFSFIVVGFMWRLKTKNVAELIRRMDGKKGENLRAKLRVPKCGRRCASLRLGCFSS